MHSQEMALITAINLKREPILSVAISWRFMSYKRWASI